MKGMLFCDVCGKILEIKEKDDKTFALCICGFTKQIEFLPVFSEKIKEKNKLGEGVIKEEINTDEGFVYICNKCGHDKCDISSVGASYSDESDVILYKCKKCSFVKRQADGSSNN